MLGEVVGDPFLIELNLAIHNFRISDKKFREKLSIFVTSLYKCIF